MEKLLQSEPILFGFPRQRSPITCGLSSATTGLNDYDHQKFDKICADLARTYAFFCELYFCSLRISKPKLYYPSILGFLLALAYVGNKTNNLFLAYLVALLVALHPVLDRKGFT